ncbi:MAG: ribulose-phosphate 3-epimerase [Elusimicrobiota bacterium]|jgi:ribulose-phosphate 3-epimerase|nr:ribulose-phosphate 3-epimerase [Elusimicrobiota bacterium]
MTNITQNSKMKIELSPSLLSADFLNLEKQLKILENENIKRIHLDIMDGNFVPNISFGQPILKSLRKKTKLLFETHLMIQHPENYIKSFKDAGSDILIFHYEATTDHIYLIEEIKNLGMKAGISIKPATCWEEIGDLLPLLDIVLIMSVEPGFSGQHYMPETARKMKFMHSYVLEKNLNIDIAIDGGINENTIQDAVKNGANILISASAVFSNDENIMRANIKKLNSLIKNIN